MKEIWEYVNANYLWLVQAVRLEKDFNAYKVRAYSLLQKKEAELSAAKDAEWLAAQEASLKVILKMLSFIDLVIFGIVKAVT
jgi:hypothetical protein